MNDLAAAATAFSRSISIDPSNTEAHIANVSVLRAAGNLNGAIVACKKALLHHPNDVRLLCAAALCFEDAGKVYAAIAHYDTALQMAPACEDALHNRGLLLSRLGRLDEAEANHRNYVCLHPKDVRAPSGLVDILLARGSYEQAIEVLDELGRHLPNDVSVAVRRGAALASLRRFAESRKAFEGARTRDSQKVADYLQRIAPGAHMAQMLTPENIYLERAWSALGQCDWTRWDDFVSELREIARNPGIAAEPVVAFMSRLAPLTPSERHAVARQVAATTEAEFPALEPVKPAVRERVRIGILSPDFREHLNAYLLLPLFELVDRERFAIHAYSLWPDDGSTIAKRVRSAAESFKELDRVSERQIAQIIRNDDIDILLDVAGHTTGGRFAVTALRPARIQVNYLGFSCSLASSRVDYAIVDRIVGNDDAEWTEARVYLPHTHFLYDFRAQQVAAEVSRSEYGLPEDAFVYCAFHRAEKISPDLFALWMRILAKVPHSNLWFRALSDPAASNLRNAAERSGVDPSRLAFAPFEASHDPRYLARHRLGDLMLDSLHHNAMTSACDALGMGLPLLTLRGYALAARAGESLVRAAGLPELVASDQEDYVKLAVQLSREPTQLQALKNRLRFNRRSAPLFDTAGRVRALEAAFQGMYDRMMRGEPPTSFDVQL